MRSRVAVKEKSARKNLCEFRVPSQENGEPLSLSHQHLQQLAPQNPPDHQTHDTPRLSPPQHNYLLLLLSSLVILFFPSLISFLFFPFMLLSFIFLLSLLIFHFSIVFYFFFTSSISNFLFIILHSLYFPLTTTKSRHTEKREREREKKRKRESRKRRGTDKTDIAREGNGNIMAKKGEEGKRW